ncbi:MAG: hypothetical protein PHI44_05475 [Candidatus Ratteibacteria bacterium]|nr:hypothetical protein [Candidatus Ratteibacteria bacterium]
MKKHKKLLTVLTVVIVIIIASLFFTERYIIRKVYLITDSHITIGSIRIIPPFSVNFKKVRISYARIPELFLKTLSIRRVLTESAFAFSGPGNITIQDTQKDVKIKGSVSGNYKEGKLDIKKTHITIEDIGSFEVKGGLEQWGKEGINLVIDLKGTEIEEVKKMFGLNLPFNGKVSGTLSFDYSKNKDTSMMQFDITVQELATEEGNTFTAFVKGTHNIKEGKTDIEDGKLLNGKGGQILFSGYIDRENFNINFETQNMPLESLLNLIPEDIRTKYNISVSNGSASMKNFNIEKVKKKSV